MSMSESGAFSTYRAELAKRATLTPDAERDIAIRFRRGDRDAGRQLIEACLPFVVTIALEYRRWGLPLEDIVQEGNIGLLKGAARFDPDRGCRLATYAAYWIRAEIREYVVRSYRIVRIGASKGERRALRIFRKTHERDAAVLSELSGLSEQRVTELLPLLLARDVSLDRVPDGGVAPLERLAASQASPEDLACVADERAQLSVALGHALAELSPRERRIIDERWLSESPVTLETLGGSFGVSKERVRQIEERVLERLRARLSSADERRREPLARSA